MYKKEFFYTVNFQLCQSYMVTKWFSQECKVGITFETQLVVFTIVAELMGKRRFNRYSKIFLQSS